MIDQIKRNLSLINCLSFKYMTKLRHLIIIILQRVQIIKYTKTKAKSQLIEKKKPFQIDKL